MNATTFSCRIDWTKVRKLCIDQNWYTRGDNEAYSNMLFKLCEGTTLTAIRDIAKDIVAHSNPDTMADMANQCDKPAFKCVMDYLLNDCTWLSID